MRLKAPSVLTNAAVCDKMINKVRLYSSVTVQNLNDRCNMEGKSGEKTISLGELFASVKANLALVIALTVIVGAIGAVYAFMFKKTTYTARATLQVYVNPEETNIPETTAYSFGTYLAEDYMKVLKYPEYIKNAADKGVKINAGGLKFSHEEKSVLLEVSYTVKSKQNIRKKVADDLNGYLEYTKEAIDEGENSNYANRLKIESVATENDVTASRGALTTVLIALVAGFALSIIVVIIKYFADDKFRSKEDVEAVTGATVLTVIGLSYGDKKKDRAEGETKNV